MSIPQDSIQEKIEQLKLDIPVCNMVEEHDAEGDQTQKNWTQQPYSKKAQLRRQDVVSVWCHSLDTTAIQ